MPIKLNNFFKQHQKAEDDEKSPPQGGIEESITTKPIQTDEADGKSSRKNIERYDPYIDFFINRLNAVEVTDGTMANAGRSKNRSSGYYK